MAFLPAIHRDAERTFRSLKGDAHRVALQVTIANTVVAFVQLMRNGNSARAVAALFRIPPARLSPLRPSSTIRGRLFSGKDSVGRFFGCGAA
jgi:hypothetical protein